MLNVGPTVSRICSPASSMSQPPSTDAKDWRRLYPFASHWADLPGGRMHYLDEGPHARERRCRVDAALRPWQSHLVVPLAAIDRGAEAELPLRSAVTTSAVASVRSRRGYCRWRSTSKTCVRSSDNWTSNTSRSSPRIGAAPSVSARCSECRSDWQASCCSTRAHFRRDTFPGEFARAAFL